MILYLDSSALVKRYIAEVGSIAVSQWLAQADWIATGLISRAEVSAAIARARRVGVLISEDAQRALNAFRTEWGDFLRLPVSEIVVSRADSLAWEHDLRGFDALHLASALLWQEGVGEQVTLATFDKQMWVAAGLVGLNALPEEFVL